MKTALCYLLLLLPLAAPAAPIDSYTLVNADTDLDIQPLVGGAVLDLATLPTRNLNIRANPGPGPVGSVVFALRGGQTEDHTENVAPYALFSDNAGDYFAWTPPLGSYTLAATAYAGPDGSGLAGPPLAIAFTVVNSVGGLLRFVLVNADTDLDIQPLANGAVLDLAALPTRNLNVRADPGVAATASVVFALRGAQTEDHTENVRPYALFSDLNGDYFAWTPATGSYTLTATPYNDPNGSGPAGPPLTVAFAVRGGPLPVGLTAFSASATAEGVALAWTTAHERQCAAFEVERSLDGRTFAAVGTVPGQGTTTTAHAYRYTDPSRPAAATQRYYRLRQLDTDGTAAYSPVRAVWVAGPAAAFAVFPTVVADGWVRYTFAGPSTGTGVLQVLNAAGQGGGPVPLAAGGAGAVAVAGLPAGTYWLRLTGGGRRYAGRFVVP